jgi:polysaccharide biosynthesis/export protein
MLGGCANAYPPELVPQVPSRGVAPEFYRPEPQTDYKVAVGDKLSISSYYHPDLKQTVTVQPDGQVPLLLIGSVVAAGKSPQRLSDELTKGYSKYVENAEITVAVAESASLAVYVGGQVKNPSLVPIRGELTLLQSITEAGGFLTTADESQVLIVRQMPDSRHWTLQANVEKVLRNESGEIYLRPHDIVYVPKSEIAKVDEFIDQHLSQVVPRWLIAVFGLSYQLNSGIGGPTVVTTP